MTEEVEVQSRDAPWCTLHSVWGGALNFFGRDMEEEPVEVSEG